MSVRNIDVSELVLHHSYAVSEEDLLRICLIKSSHMLPTLYWCDGIMFYYEPLLPMFNPEIEKDFMNGKDHWVEVYYAACSEYKSVLELNEGEFKGAKIRVIDASQFQPHKEFAKWARESYTGKRKR